MTDSAGKQVLRDLAKRYAEIAADPRQQETIDGWKRLNGLKETRPMVRVDQLPWHELPWGEDKMVSKDDPLLGKTPGYWSLEGNMRRTIYAWENFKADMVVLPYIGIAKIARKSAIGPDAKIESKGLSKHFEEQLATIEEVEALEAPVVEVDPELDQQRLEQANEIFDGIMPVKLVGRGRHTGLWDGITCKISPERMLYDLIDRPEYVHVLINKFVEMENKVLDQFEEHGLLEAAPADIHCTGAFTDELPSKDYDGDKATAKDTWCFTMAQMFSEVSPSMQEEFDIKPLKPLIERYGLAYYGCCEPLHNKIDIVRNNLNNVRKISISPWADKEIAAENIHGDYVFSAKPNPAHVAMVSLDKDLIRKDLAETVEICMRHNTPCELILKDVSTVNNDPSRLSEWEKIAMEVVGA